jgi:di/tricarboxylate transporter
MFLQLSKIISGIILISLRIIMALNLKWFTLEMAAVTGALVCVLTGCLTEKQAYASIDWVTIFLFAGMMPVSTALDKTGAGKLIASWAVAAMGGSPSPMVCTIVLFIISCGLTQFMSNTASAALCCARSVSPLQTIRCISASSIDGYCRSSILRIRNSCRYAS